MPRDNADLRSTGLARGARRKCGMGIAGADARISGGGELRGRNDSGQRGIGLGHLSLLASGPGAQCRSQPDGGVSVRRADLRRGDDGAGGSRDHQRQACSSGRSDAAGAMVVALPGAGHRHVPACDHAAGTEVAAAAGQPSQAHGFLSLGVRDWIAERRRPARLVTYG